MRTLDYPTPTATPTGKTPAVPKALARGMATAVGVANAIAVLVSVAVVAATGRAELWPAAVAGISVGLIGAALSAAVLMQAAGRGVDWLPTFVLGASACRLGTSAAGLLVAVQAFHTPAEWTAGLVGLFYGLTLVAESVSLRRAVGGGEIVGGANA